ncbi:phospholipid-transporting ATPase ABCA3-like [Dugong dugon]
MKLTSGPYVHVKSWRTAFLFPSVSSVGPRNMYDSTGGDPGYINEGFLLLQHSVDKAIMLYHSSGAAEKLFDAISIFVQRFPYPTHHRDVFFTYSGFFIPLVVLFMFSVNHFTLIRSIVWEKENRLKEYQLMIGFRNWMLWAAYFITFLFLYLIVIFFVCMIFFTKIEPVPVLQHSDPSLIFVFLLCFAIASIFFSFMVSTFFNKANYAVAFGGFLYFATYFPYNIISQNYAKMTLFQKLTSCLSSNIAMALGTQFLVKAEVDNIGIKWSNILSSTQIDNFVFAYILGMLLFDAFLYGLVTWYIEAVFPGEYGVPKPWNFFLLHSYWFGESTEKNKERTQFYETIQSKYFEPEPTDLVAGIQIKHLRKTFRARNTTKIAVRDLSLNLYEGQITVLLGHNGAGKSTTLSILSGLYPPTSGKVIINRYDTSKDMVQIRKSLGLCPQQDLLFNYLTVSEHLYFYCVIKGIPRKLRPMEIDHMLSAFNLLEKRDAFSQSLSGGMKRKLSIITALIGGSKVVILDEPTSGMDTVSRRVTWDLLQQYKQDRTILLTTHCMDEADALGDRIAIMVRGTLQCCGSSIFLKQIYGVGYHIVMVKEPHCDVKQISQLLHHHIPTATLENDVGSELSFILPKEYTHRFQVLFTDLEERQKELGIASFGASVSTMEEVFLRVSNVADSQDTNAIQPPFQMNKFLKKNQDVNTSVNFETVDCAIFNESSTIKFNTGGVVKYCKVEVFLMENRFLDVMLIFMLYGWSAIPLMYLMSFLFSESTAAYIKLVLFNYFSGIFSLLLDMTLEYKKELETKISNDTRTLMLNALLLFPNYNLAKALEDYSDVYHDKTLCNTLKHPPPYINCTKANTEKNVYSLEENMIGKYLIMMSTLGFVLLLLIFVWETTLWKLKIFLNRYIYFGIYKKFKNDIVSKELSGESEDEDVEEERKRILELPQELLNTVVLIKELIKIYFKCPAILAVKNISLRIQKGECFGLLGVNGAGKTSIFKMLTGERTATSGDMFIEGFSITHNILKVKSRIGYCPQSDALLEYMTGREIMIMYARIWGVSEPQIHLYVNNWLKSLHLEPHADKLIYTYSGGNKRRLSTAIALMGRPSVIFLDEPSTGMDPAARRLLWNLITQMRETGNAIVITSHSMEECEALCTRLAIMAKGKFMCLGSPQHLKNKFGQVYILKAKVKPDTGEDKLEDFKIFISTTFPGSVIKQENQRIVNYYIPSKDNSWAKVFGILEEAKEEFSLEDYSISQITLEQVFLTFAYPDKTEDEYKKKVP